MALVVWLSRICTLDTWWMLELKTSKLCLWQMLFHHYDDDLYFLIDCVLTYFSCRRLYFLAPREISMALVKRLFLHLFLKFHLLSHCELRLVNELPWHDVRLFIFWITFIQFWWSPVNTTESNSTNDNLIRLRTDVTADKECYSYHSCATFSIHAMFSWH